jgi:hypothetical protein
MVTSISIQQLIKSLVLKLQAFGLLELTLLDLQVQQDLSEQLELPEELEQQVPLDLLVQLDRLVPQDQLV